MFSRPAGSRIIRASNARKLDVSQLQTEIEEPFASSAPMIVGPALAWERPLGRQLACTPRAKTSSPGSDARPQASAGWRTEQTLAAFRFTRTLILPSILLSHGVAYAVSVQPSSKGTMMAGANPKVLDAASLTSSVHSWNEFGDSPFMQSKLSQ